MQDQRGDFSVVVMIQTAGVWGGDNTRAGAAPVDGAVRSRHSAQCRRIARGPIEMAADQPAGVTRMIGGGAPKLIERAARVQGRELDQATHASLVERFFHHYGALEENGECEASVYEGAAEALRRLHEAGLRIAIVTNKQQRFAQALLRLLGLIRWVDLVVGGDTCERRKPDPQPLLHACAAFGVPPTAALMVGDSTNDVQAARAAGIPVLCVPHGYNEGEDPRALPCDAIVEKLTDVADALLATPAPDESSGEQE